jgi:glycosyltransferase involved in cell wall biosynthesis
MKSKEKYFSFGNFPNSKVCFLGNFPPKECGIATFTEDLVSTMNKNWNPKVKSRVIALNAEEEFHNYDNRVINQINKDDIEDFIKKAKEINESEEIRIVCIQHEFGIFGGDEGSYLIPFLETISKPVVVTFHSVVPDPDPCRQRVVRFIGEKAAAMIVMAESAVDILVNDYGVDKKKIHVVRHGIPDAPAPLNSTNEFKKKLKLDKHTVLSTFGLLSRGKGIEYMIRSLPKLVEKYPDILYLVIGETHPKVRDEEGEEYRKELLREVKELGLQKNVKFVNKYLTLKQIVEYLIASDIYICTNLDINQIVSGTLSYAMGCGKAVVSTPSVYAKEVLSSERGLLANFRSPKDYAKAIDRILSDKEFRTRIERNAYQLGRSMSWPNVAARYLNIFNKVVMLREETTEKFPKVKLSHLRRMTDSFGCIQFSKMTTPDKSSGYTVDDNSRALITAVMHHSLYHSKKSLRLAKTYIKFLEHAQGRNGHFLNNLSNHNELLDPCSEDALGRALWSLGYTIYRCPDKEMCERANSLFRTSYRLIEKIGNLRAKAYAIIGLYYYNKKYPDRENLNMINKLAGAFVDSFNGESASDWKWFEKEITYANAKLPEALFLAYDSTKNRDYLSGYFLL